MKIRISTKYARPCGVGSKRSQRGRLVGHYLNILTRYAALAIGLIAVPAMAQGERPSPTPPPAPDPIVVPGTLAGEEAEELIDAEDVVVEQDEEGAAHGGRDRRTHKGDLGRGT